MRPVGLTSPIEVSELLPPLTGDADELSDEHLAAYEAALAAFAIKEYLEPGKKVHLQYTTTSPLMHKRLGVESAEEQAAARKAASG